MAAVSVFTGRWRQTSHTGAVSGILILVPQGQKRFYRFSLRLNAGFKTLAVNIFLLLPDNDYTVF